MITQMLLKNQFNLLKLARYSYTSKMRTSSMALMLTKFGEPQESLELVDITQEVLNHQLKNEELLIQFMASPINPADVSTVRGIYGVKPTLPSKIGNEGVAKVLKVGHLVKNLQSGDWVIPTPTGYGTWRTHAIASQTDLLKVDNELDLFSAAQLMVNPSTAYRMMKDFVHLKPGDCLLQNGANSAVGLFVIQLAKEWGVKTVNVIRARPDPKDTEKLKAELTEYGADFVVTDQELEKKEVMNQIWSKGAPKPKLVLDCVGGKMASDCVNNLNFKGTMVTYGAMSRQPLVIPTGLFIFKDLRFYSFWLTRWRNDKSKFQELQNMIKELSSLMKNGKLRLPKVIPFDLADYKNAFDALNSEFSKGKVILTMKA